MKHACFFLLLVLYCLSACKKHPYPPFNCSRISDCPIDVFSPYAVVERGDDGRPTKFTGVPSAWGNYKTLLITYEGRTLVMKDSAWNDFVLTARLDDCGRAIYSDYYEADAPYPGGESMRTNYFYDRKGRLTHFTMDLNNYYDTAWLHYDTYGNILRIDDGITRCIYEYDYSTPVGKACLYTEIRSLGWAPMDFLTILGHIDLKPQHLRKSAESWSRDYMIGKEFFANYRFEGNKVIAYDHVYYDPEEHVRETHWLQWSCLKRGRH